MSLIVRLAEFGLNASFDKLPAPVVNESKRILLDSLGCALSAQDVYRGRKALEIARRLSGAAEATVIGTGEKLSMSAAVFANAELINAMDYDVLTAPPGHVTPYVLPAILAAGEERRCSGKTLIAAIAVAHEVSVRFGRAMGYYRDVTAGERVTVPAVSGFSSTIFGGTLGAALVRRFDKARIASAMGLAGHIAPPQTFGKWGRTIPASDTKYQLAGWICQAEILAVMMAETGYQGDVDVLEGDYGFWRFMGSSRWTPEAFDGIEDNWTFPAVTLYKTYPHCGASQTAVECAAHLIKTHGLRPDEIDKIVAYTDGHTARLPLYRVQTVETTGDAQMSPAYAISMVVHDVPVGSQWHAAPTLANKEYLSFMSKVQMEPHPDYDEMLAKEPESRIGRAEIFARGQVFVEQRNYRRGTPARPETTVSNRELVEKFCRSASELMTHARAEDVAKAIFAMEHIDDMTELAAMWRRQ